MADATALTVYLVDDDPAIRDALGLLLGLRGYRCATFACAEDFLAAWQPGWTGCVVADLRMPGIDGLALQQALIARGCALPFIVMTGHGDVEAARRAFKADAVDFLEKPFGEDGPIAAIEAAFRRESLRLEGEAGRRDREAAMASLTAREREVVDLLVQGFQNREIGERLAISPRTVEVHRARSLEKLGLRTLAELIRLLGRA